MRLAVFKLNTLDYYYYSAFCLKVLRDSLSSQAQHSDITVIWHISRLTCLILIYI